MKKDTTQHVMFREPIVLILYGQWTFDQIFFFCLPKQQYDMIFDSLFNSTLTH